MAKPALMLPMGEGDWKEGSRLLFMKSCLPILESLGWTIGAEIKGSSFDDWTRECILALKKFGGRITAHPPNTTAWDLGKLGHPIPDKLMTIAQQAPEFKKLGLEAITIHCAPALSVDPPEDAGLERYNSPISAEEMLEHIKRQIQPLVDVNAITGGILQIENVDIINFRGGGHYVPTYLQVQTGSWMDLLYLKKESGVQATFDSEHHFCAGNLLYRRGRFMPIPTWGPDDYVNAREFRAAHRLAKIAGYYLMEGKPPITAQSVGWREFISDLRPTLFHLGGAIRTEDDDGRIETHLPSFGYPLAKEALDFELLWTMEHPEVIGCVIEVAGQLDPKKYSPTSPRPENDNDAKMTAYRTVIEAIERIQKGKN